MQASSHCSPMLEMVKKLHLLMATHKTENSLCTVDLLLRLGLKSYSTVINSTVTFIVVLLSLGLQPQRPT